MRGVVARLELAINWFHKPSSGELPERSSGTSMARRLDHFDFRHHDED
ncbi:MAG: hypothetical protein AAFY16_01150 [Cyanobacteria bacterium J06642_3]